MKIEITPNKRSASERHSSDALSIASGLSSQQNISGDIKISRKFITRRQFNSCIKSQKTTGFVAVLLISLSITIGVLTVYLTSPKSSMF